MTKDDLAERIRNRGYVLRYEVRAHHKRPHVPEPMQFDPLWQEQFESNKRKEAA